LLTGQIDVKHSDKNYRFSNIESTSLSLGTLSC